MDVCKLGEGTLGLAAEYPSEFRRVIQRAANVLIDCKAIGAVAFKNGTNHSGLDVVFEKYKAPKKSATKRRLRINEDEARQLAWANRQNENKLKEIEQEALKASFGQDFERDYIRSIQQSTFDVSNPMRVRFVWKYLKSKSKAA